MAVRARLTPPRKTRRDWPWHTVKSASLSAELLFRGERRMEAAGLLASGFMTRMAIESKRTGWVRLVEIAHAWQPPRLRGIQVGPKFGTPFLTASQVFDLPPIPRKWLSLEQTEHAQERFVTPGTILVTCSGTVGRTTLARKRLEHTLISHDILRVEPNKEPQWGWLYAYLRAPSVIEMMQATHYGHVVKHLEVEHLHELPVVQVDARTRLTVTKKVQRIADNRNQADEFMAEAHALLATAFRLHQGRPRRSTHSIARVGDVSSGRRRLEGSFHAAQVTALLKRVARHALRVDRLGSVTARVWWMTRFSRTFGAGGVPYMSADELFSISQISEKRVHLGPIPRHKEFFVKEGWILMACSGQVYGLNGSVTLATKHDESFFFSHDLIRIAPRTDAIRSGYLFAYLGHRALGRILAQRTAYGSSVPHLDPGDVEDVPIGRLAAEQENRIADLAEEASRLNAEAAELERTIGRQADEVVRRFVA